MYKFFSLSVPGIPMNTPAAHHLQATTFSEQKQHTPYEFLFEMLSEEIPARFQRSAALQLKEKTLLLLKEFHVEATHIITHCGPRRLTLALGNITQNLPQSAVKRGPPAACSQEILQHFCATWSVSPQDCYVEDTPRGAFWFAPHRPVAMALEKTLEALCCKILDSFFWPKKMVWGPQDNPGQQVVRTWVRPLRRLLCIYKGQPLPWTWDPEGLALGADNITEGHPLALFWEKGIHATTQPFRVTSYDHYIQALHLTYVMVEEEERLKALKQGLEQAYQQYHCIPWLGEKEQDALLEEVAGLTEWPVCVVGKLEEAFLPPHVPEPLVVKTICAHQRVFPLKSLQTGAIAPYFVVATNLAHPQEQVIKGYERVIRARLADALFFWRQDCATAPQVLTQKLHSRLFFQGLGTLGDKVQRLELLAQHWPQGTPQEVTAVAQAAALCKTDLVTGTVGEFPSLQGTMGHYYALHHGFSLEVAQALEEYYGPVGEDQALPQTLGRRLGILDRLDTLVGFFALGHIPSASKDPLALRRAATGLVTLCLAETTPLDLGDLMDKVYQTYGQQGISLPPAASGKAALWEFLAQRLRHILHKEGLPHAFFQCAFSAQSTHNVQALDRHTRLLHKIFTTPQGLVVLEVLHRVQGLEEAAMELQLPKATLPPEPWATPQEHVLWQLLETPLPPLAGEISLPSLYHAFQAHMEPWPQALTQFLDRVHVLEEGLASQRWALLQKITAHFAPLGPLQDLPRTLV